MSLLNKIKDQSVFNFTGKINILSRINSQHIALVFLKDGKIVNCYYQNKDSLKALMALIFDEIEGRLEARFVPEPELIDESMVTLNLEFEELKRLASAYYNDYQNSKKLKPPGHLKLMINEDFILEGQEIDYREFSLLCTLAKCNNVDDIYSKSEFIEHETTMLLVALRTKKAIRVLA